MLKGSPRSMDTSSRLTFVQQLIRGGRSIWVLLTSVILLAWMIWSAGNWQESTNLIPSNNSNQSPQQDIHTSNIISTEPIPITSSNEFQDHTSKENQIDAERSSERPHHIDRSLTAVEEDHTHIVSSSHEWSRDQMVLFDSIRGWLYPLRLNRFWYPINDLTTPTLLSTTTTSSSILNPSINPFPPSSSLISFSSCGPLTTEMHGHGHIVLWFNEGQIFVRGKLDDRHEGFIALMRLMGYGLTEQEIRERGERDPALAITKQYFASNFSTILTLLTGDEPTRFEPRTKSDGTLTPTTMSHDSSCYPPFSFTISPQSQPLTLPLPCYTFSGFLRRGKEYLINIWSRSYRAMISAGDQAGPFEKRDSRVVYLIGWRSATTANGETRAAYENILKQQPNRVVGSFNFNKAVPMPSQCNFKYILYAGGVSGHSWSSRLKHIFLCGSVILWVEERLEIPAYAEFWYSIMQPYVHFVPVTQQNFWSIIDELEANPGVAARIAEAGRNRLKEMLTPNFIYDYIASTLNQWNSNLPIGLSQDMQTTHTTQLSTINAYFDSHRLPRFESYQFQRIDERIKRVDSQDLAPYQTLQELGIQ